MKIATNDDVQTANPAPVVSPEFQHIPLDMLIVEAQVRSEVLTTGEEFRTFLESIRQEGVIEPVVAARRDGKFALIAGERRLRACQMLGIPTIPARILENVEAEKALKLQLMENLHRENLNPIDEAAAYVRYFRMRKGDLPLDDIIKTLDNLSLDPLRVDTESSQAATAIRETAGKSLTTIRRVISLLKLSQEIQDAVRYGKIPVTHAYLFAAELDNPGLTAIFKSLLEKPLTVEALKRRLNEARKGDTGQNVVKSDTIATYRRNIKNFRVSLQLQKGKLTIEQADTLLTDLREVLAIIEGLKAEAGGPSQTTQ
jgi:ParB family transcriptional regulator, chromosome partitioning protein